MHRYILFLLLVLPFTACSNGPDVSKWKDKGYNADNDFHAIINNVLHLAYSLPYDFKEEENKKYTQDELLMISLEYYTPQNVQKILDRIDAYLKDAELNNTKDQFLRLKPKNHFELASTDKLRQIILFREVEGADFQPEIALRLAYRQPYYMAMPQNLAGPTINPLFLNEQDRQNPANYHSNNIIRRNDFVEINLPLTDADIQGIPEIEAIIQKVHEREALESIVQSFDGWKENIKTIPSNPENAITKAMKNNNLKERIKKFLETTVLPKNQAAVQAKADAFYKAWGI